MGRFWVIAPYRFEENTKEIFERAWQYDLENGTIAVGWRKFSRNIYHITNKNEFKWAYIKAYGEDQPAKRSSLWRFLHEISMGDIIIARKGLKTIIGVGEVISEPFWDDEKGKARVGYIETQWNPDDFITPNFRKVKWEEKVIHFDKQVFTLLPIYQITEEKFKLLIEGSTTEQLYHSCKKTGIVKEETYETPAWLIDLKMNIEELKNDKEHKERAHESLVESFYGLLGFAKFTEIKHRQGRIDISIEHEGKIIIVTEVKKDWNLSYRDKNTILQAYNYSLESGARFVIITNGDYYAIFDKDKGHSYESNFIGEFKVSKLKKDDLALIEKFRKENILHD
jgi:hypothetical protein